MIYLSLKDCKHNRSKLNRQKSSLRVTLVNSNQDKCTKSGANTTVISETKNTRKGSSVENEDKKGDRFNQCC